MLKKFITVAGINTTTKFVDGDRESDQGTPMLIVIDRYLDPRVIFSILKRTYPNCVLVSSGVLSIRPKGEIVMLEGSQDDQLIIDSHILGIQILLTVTIQNCYYTSNIRTPNTLNKEYPLGHLAKLLKELSLIENKLCIL